MLPGFSLFSRSFQARSAGDARADCWLSPISRFLAASAALSLLVLLAVAWRLEPSAAGFGTHQQLGLPPCTSVQLFDVRCPACGMTTAWACLMRGRVALALGANVGGTLLGIGALLAGPWLLMAAARGRWPVRSPQAHHVAWTGVLVLVVTCIDWVCRLML